MNRYTKIKDFHGSRRTGVGASDIPTLTGLNKRYGSTPLTLWREKTGRASPFEGNNRTKWGNYLEPMVLREWIEKVYGPEPAMDFYRNSTRAEPVSTGPFKIKTEARHPDYHFALSHADLLIDWGDDEYHAPHIVEAKTSGFYSGKRREGLVFDGYDPEDFSQFGIPDKVFMQVQWQMFTYGVTHATLSVLIDTADYREYGPIVYDPRHVEKSLALAERFWYHVEHDKEPTPTTWDDVVSLYPTLENTTAMVSGEEEQKAREAIARAEDLKSQIKTRESELEDIKSAIGVLIGGNAVLASSNGDTLAKAAERQRESLGLLSEVTKVRKKTDPTNEDLELLQLDSRLRELGLVKVSKWREVRF